jgi:hypothetical protein
VTIDITCPTCGTLSYFDELTRDAHSFCRVCDYPLFWVRNTKFSESEDGGDTGLRRLPGTAGRVAVAMIACPVCTEPNPVALHTCIRCGANLRPPPAPAPVPPPPPPPPPVYVRPPEAPAPTRRWWPWVALAAVAVAGIVVLVVLLID